LATTVSPAKTHRPIGVEFLAWTLVGPRNYLLDGDLDSPKSKQFGRSDLTRRGQTCARSIFSTLFAME